MITLFEKFNFYKNGSNIAYSAIILNNKSKLLLLNKFIYTDPVYNTWNKYADHMTICLGELPIHIKRYWLNEDIELTVTHIGYNDNAIAVKVDGLFTISKKFEEEIKQQHITLAVNPLNGKPYDSNLIVNWKPVEKFIVTGTVKEVEI